MTAQFYRDEGDQVVARLAKAICRSKGRDPYELVRDNGYRNAPKIPAWWQEQGFARAFIACHNEAAEVLGQQKPSEDNQ